jgi:3-hydroxyisobutyrate dehydrogenase
MVGFPGDVEQVILGPDGALAGARAGSVAVDMTTSQPSLAVRIHAEAAAKGMGAREAKLAIMVGGERPVFERVLPLFQTMGETIALMGGPGSGQHAKMVNQIAIAGSMIGVVEGLLYAHKAGLDPAAVIDVIGKGAAGSWSINNLGRRMKLGLPGLALVHQFYVSAQAVGLENLGTQGLYQALARMNGM